MMELLPCWLISIIREFSSWPHSARKPLGNCWCPFFEEVFSFSFMLPHKFSQISPSLFSPSRSSGSSFTKMSIPELYTSFAFSAHERHIKDPERIFFALSHDSTVLDTVFCLSFFKLTVCLCNYHAVRNDNDSFCLSPVALDFISVIIIWVYKLDRMVKFRWW